MIHQRRHVSAASVQLVKINLTILSQSILWIPSDTSNGKIEKDDINNDAFTELKRQLKEFLIHTYVKRKQAAYMTSLISGPR